MFPTAQGSNRTNSSGIAPAHADLRGSLTYNNIIPANGTLQIPAAGNQFYVIVTTSPITIQPNAGAAVQYSSGTGLQLDIANSFSLLRLTNPNSFSVTFSIFIGFDSFIDRRLYLNQNLTPQVAYPTYSIPNTATSVDINDLSGQAFNDINGNKWLAISRTAIEIFNLDTGTTYLLYKKGATGAPTDKAIGAIYPALPIKFDFSGDYKLTAGGPLNLIVNEIYSSLSATT